MGRLVKASATPLKVPVAPAPDREAALGEITALLAAARADAESVRARAKDAAVVLARRMAEKIVGHAVDLDPALMGDIVAQALAASRAKAGAVVLRVHPDELPDVEAARARWGRNGALVVRVVADASVGRHGCVVETPIGRVDARLEAQLDALERALRRGPT
jgi:flagellar biosynthesis/type III secretory pathway protein FliH